MPEPELAINTALAAAYIVIKNFNEKETATFLKAHAFLGYEEWKQAFNCLTGGKYQTNRRSVDLLIDDIVAYIKKGGIQVSHSNKTRSIEPIVKKRWIFHYHQVLKGDKHLLWHI